MSCEYCGEDKMHSRACPYYIRGSDKSWEAEAAFFENINRFSKVYLDAKKGLPPPLEQDPVYMLGYARWIKRADEQQ
jgi:hypothetical protein